MGSSVKPESGFKTVRQVSYMTYGIPKTLFLHEGTTSHLGLQLNHENRFIFERPNDTHGNIVPPINTVARTAYVIQKYGGKLPRNIKNRKKRK